MKISMMLVLLGLFCLTACVKDSTPEEILMDMVNANATKTHSGQLINGPYGNTSGQVHVIKNQDGSLQLKFENLKSSNGPDLKVYLSKEIQPINFINLGALKSTQGNQVYDISGVPDFIEYKYALIHCKQFNHLFGSAELVKN